MQELYVEGLATHGGPELCVDDPRGRGEALAGARAGRAIEPRNQHLRGAGAVQEAEGNIAGGVIASRRGTPRGQRTWARTEISMRENREVPRSPVPGVEGSGREGKAEAVIP
jgi:hypothetical protein